MYTLLRIETIFNISIVMFIAGAVGVAGIRKILKGAN